MANLITAAIRRFNTAQPENRQIARDLGIIIGFVLVAKCVAAVKEIVVAWRYGTSETVDAFLFVFNLTTLPVSLWYSILTMVFIPLAIRANDQKAELSHFRSELLGASIILGCIAGLIAWLALHLLFASDLAGLPTATNAMAWSMAPFLAVLIPLAVVTHFGSVLLMARQRHTNTVLEGLPSVVLLAVLLIAGQGGTVPLVVGAVLGGFAHLIVTMVAAHRSQPLARPRLAFRSPFWTVFRNGLSLMLLSQFLLSLTALIDQFFAARLDPGSIATLGYAGRLLSLGLALGATAIARATLPAFSRSSLSTTSVKRSAMHWARAMLVAGALLALTGWLLAPLAVEIMFERGNFLASDTLKVSAVLRVSLIQMPFYFAGLVLIQALLSRNMHKEVTIISLFALMLKLSANVVLAPLMGIEGLVLSTAIMYLGSLLLALFYVRNLKGLPQ